MPNKKNAKKELRKSKTKRAANTKRLATIKKLTKESRRAITAKGEQAKILLIQTTKALDKAAKKGVIKKNTAARQKSRLQLALNKATK